MKTSLPQNPEAGQATLKWELGIVWLEWLDEKYIPCDTEPWQGMFRRLRARRWAKQHGLSIIKEERGVWKY